jgi:lysophospholipase L1-like esterase
MTQQRFTRYIALGDSMTIDTYPHLDLEERDRERVDACGTRIGAASLLFRNVGALWPEFDGQDLETKHPAIEARDLAVDGGTIPHVLGWQIPELSREAGAGRAVVTVTIGGNDLLSALSKVGLGAELEREVDEIISQYTRMVEVLGEGLPEALLILTTVYDPTDGTGNLPGASEHLGRLPVEHLHRLNEHIRTTATKAHGAVLADVHRHFLGRGIQAPVEARWYWHHSIIEPNVRGASEIRRVWLESLARSERLTDDDDPLRVSTSF